MRDHQISRYIVFCQWLVIAPLKAINSWRRDVKEGFSATFQKRADLQRAMEGFLSVNAKHWQKIDADKDFSKTRQWVLVEAIIEPLAYIMTNIVIARPLMETYGLPGAGLLNKPNRKIENLFKSYGINTFYYLSDRKQGVFQSIKNAWKAVQLLGEVKNVDDFLNLKLNEISLGKVVYDNYLRSSGFGTLERVNCRAFEGLVTSIGYLEYLENIFQAGNFPVLVQAERQFIPSGLVCQTALKHKTVIFSRGGGPTTFTLCRFDALDQYYNNTHRSTQELFDYIYNNYRKEAVRGGGEHINRRFSGEPAHYDIPDAALAFKKGDERLTREEFCRRLSWDPQKPIVGIMANNLIDGVFTDNWELFRDYLTWFRETAKAIRNIDHVQWFIKPHPTDVLYKIRTSIKSEYERLAGDCPHIRFFPEGVSGSSIGDFADAILTVRGSAGIEYSCLGIPCVIAGESLYSGLGFTHEPKTQEEYFKILRNIDKLKRLTPEQVERAKTFAYIYGVLSRVKAEYLPHSSPFGDDDEKLIWENAAEILAAIKPQDDRLGAMAKIQIQRKHRHLINYDWVGGGNFVETR